MLTSPRPAFLQRVLHHHGEMGDPGEAECALGQSSSKYVASFSVRGHHSSLHQGSSPVTESDEMSTNALKD